MAGETPQTLIGNLTADPELRYTQNGKPVANFTVASTPSKFNRQTNKWEDEDALFMRCSAWNELAEHIAGSLTKGMRVIVQGNLRQRNYETREGDKRSVIELDVREIGPSLRYATAQVMRAAPQNSSQGFGAPAQGGAPAAQNQTGWATPGAAPSAPAQGEPWATPGANTPDPWGAPGGSFSDDDTPF